MVSSVSDADWDAESEESAPSELSEPVSRLGVSFFVSLSEFPEAHDAKEVRSMRRESARESFLLSFIADDPFTNYM